MVTGNILVADDDDAAIRTFLGQAVSPAGTTGNAAMLWRWVQSGEGNLVITDVVMLDENAFGRGQYRRLGRKSAPTFKSGSKTTN
jgi:two-component system, NtrC family, nitrogen regulation response regulator GlnG